MYLVGRIVNLAMNTSYTGPATVVFQDRTVNIVEGVINDVIMGYGSAAYRFPPIKSRYTYSVLLEL